MRTSPRRRFRPSTLSLDGKVPLPPGLHRTSFTAEVSNFYGNSSGRTEATSDVLESHSGLLARLSQGSALSTFGLTSLLVVHTGNPGVVDFYDDFTLTLAAQNPMLGVLVLGFAGHTVLFPTTATHDLQDQIELAEAFYDHLFRPSGSLCTSEFSVYTAGHSIGAHVALHMAARYPRIERALLLAPTICNMAVSPNGQRIGRILHRAAIQLIAAAAPVLARLFSPKFIHKAIETVDPNLSRKRHIATVASMFDRHLVRNSLSLARTEFQQIRELDAELLRLVGSRAWMYYAHHDGWVPFSDMGLVHHEAPEVETTIENNKAVTHAWCCSAPEAVAAEVGRIISGRKTRR